MKGQPMHIVVTGGNGFIGSHFVPHAVDRGHHVTVVGNTSAPQIAHGRPFDFVEGGTNALAAMPSLLKAADLVCHLASSSIPATATADPVGDIERNLSSTIRLLEAMRATGNKKFMFMSSGGAVYGHPTQTPIDENHALNPISAYGITKLAVEKYVGMYQTLYGFQALTIRPSNPYGPGQGTYGQLGAVTTFLNKALAGESVNIFGDGTIVRDFIYVSDLVDLMLRAIEGDGRGVYNCGAGIGTSLNTLLDAVGGALGHKISRNHLPARAFDPRTIVMGINRARADFGWHPQVTLDQGICLTQASIRAGMK